MEEENHQENSLKMKQKGNEEFKNGNYIQAIDFYSQAIELFQDPTYYGNRAICFLNTKKYLKCIRDCNRALELRPKYAKVQARKAAAQIAIGKIDDAIETYTKSLEQNPSNQTMSNEKAKTVMLKQIHSDFLEYEEKENWEICLKKLTSLLDKCTAGDEFIFKKMEILSKKGDYSDGIDMVKIYQSRYSLKPEFIFLSGLLYLYKGSCDHAVRMWKEGNSLDPDNPRCKNGVKLWRKCERGKLSATELFKAGKLEEAFAKYKETAELDPYNKLFNSVLYSNMGTCMTKQSKWKEALVQFNLAIKCNNKYAKAYHKRGNCNRELKKYVAAEVDYKQAHTLDSTLNLKRDIQQLSQLAKKEKEKDYYKILGVNKTATDKELKTAFRKATLKYHPDKQGGKTDEEKEAATDTFKEVNEAYSVLTDPQKRKQVDMGCYEADGSGGGGGNFHFNMGDMFSQGGGGMGGGGAGNIFRMFMGGGGGGMGGGGQRRQRRQQGGNPFAGFNFQ